MRLVTVISCLAGLVPVSAFASGLEHVKQTIYGMDCAPCAYGVEQGLKGLSGVEDVTVSLNDGYAEVLLSENSEATLADIRQVIRQNGFSPKDADVRVSGTVVQSNEGQLLLRTGVETFVLNAQQETVLAQLSEKDSAVTVTGSVPTGDGQQLSIMAIE